jgi:hypothetical protein
MYRNYKSVENITSFEVKNNYLQYVKGNSLFINDKIIDNNTDCIGVFIDEIYFVYSNYSDFKSRIYNIEKNEIFKIVDYNIQNLKSNFGYLAYNYDEKFNSNLLILNSDFNIQNNTNLLNTTISLVKGDIGIQKFNNTQIHAYTLPAAQPLWQFDIGHFGVYKPIYGRPNERKPYQVAKFLGLWQEELLLACEGGLIIALSLQIGKLIRKWDVLPEQIENNLKDTFHGLIHQSGEVFQLNKAGDTIFGLYYQHWVEISLKTGLITAKCLKETFDKQHISSFQTKSGYAEDETHLYSTVFLDQQKLGLNYMPTAVCALNKLTCEIDWLHRFDFDNTGDYVSVQVPQVTDNKLYQLTQNHILHIFQKENPST